jgi:tetratricopeptide (TPR) repeat protein
MVSQAGGRSSVCQRIESEGVMAATKQSWSARVQRTSRKLQLPVIIGLSLVLIVTYFRQLGASLSAFVGTFAMTGWVTYAVWLQVRMSRATVWQKRAIELFNLKRYDEALAATDHALHLNPNFMDAWNGRGVACANLGRYEEALLAFDRILTSHPNAAMVLQSKGNTLLRMRRPLEALAVFERQIALEPNKSRAWANKGSALVKLRRYEDAPDAEKQSLLLDPTAPRIWGNLATILDFRLGRHDEALAVANEALSLGISNTGIWAVKGDALSGLGREAEAREAFERALTFPTNDPESWGRGDALAGLGRYFEALSEYDASISLNPDLPGVFRKKAAVLRRLGRDDEALVAEQHADELER